MKSRGKRILAVCTLLCITFVILGWNQYRKIRSVHEVAKQSVSESFSDQHGNFFFVGQSVLESDLVIRGTILDPASAVQASPKQTEVAYPQGWAAALASVDSQFSGRNESREVLIVPAGWWPTPVVGNSFLQPFKKGERYLLFLNKDEELSRWCDQTVYRHSGQSPIPLPKPGSNSPDA